MYEHTHTPNHTHTHTDTHGRRLTASVIKFIKCRKVQEEGKRGRRGDVRARDRREDPNLHGLAIGRLPRSPG